MNDPEGASYGSSPRKARGTVSHAEIERVAIDLLKSGRRPTVLSVRKTLGRGSALTLATGLRRFWTLLGLRAEGNAGALRRLPPEVADIAESLWQRALELSTLTATREDNAARQRLDLLQREADVRTHALALRERELDELLRARERSLAELEGQLRVALTVVARSQATIDSLHRQLRQVQRTAAASPEIPALAPHRRPPGPRARPPRDAKPARKVPGRAAASVRRGAAVKNRTARKRPTA